MHIILLTKWWNWKLKPMGYWKKLILKLGMMLFCFACIDNWATVTNICPLCQREFQLITCIPVYDTIGSRKADEDSFPRDDDWCIQGNCNTLSFPSYYIDENAVICLDGDGCKIRNGLVAVEENLNLDTSIACDSCDLWYHAYCVGFVPESSTNNSWLCPRCITDEVPPESDWISAQRQGNQFGPETSGHESSIDVGFSGKVSVSVADAGETAVVVSLVERVQWTQESSDNLFAVTEVVMDPEKETFLSNSNATSSMMETQLKETTKTKPNIGAQELSLGLSSSQDTSLTHSALVTKSYDKAIFEPNGSDGCIVPFKPSIQPCIASAPSESESSVVLHLDPSVRSLSVESEIDDATENQVARNMQQYNSAEPSSSVGRMDRHANADVVGLAGVKRKSMISMNSVEKYNCTENEDGEARAKKVTKLSSKKALPEEKPRPTTQKCQVQDSALKDFQKSSRLLAISENDKLLGDQERETETSDIMSIVRGTDRKSSEGHQCPKATDKSTRDKDNAAGLRVKKIMRRATEDKESSVQVQKLREEIREAVHNKSSKDLGKNIFDPKLLSAFRAAIAGPRTEPVQKSSPSIVRLKRSIVPKGKIRENLTKKIYGTASGRRRRAWDRDWEIEFWKHRCMRTSKPEKVETLKLVLDLLNKGSGMEQESEMDMENPILSRLYLADASVFPRKDDIKPLSVLTGVGDQKKNDECKIVEKVSIPIDNHMVQSATESTSKDSTEMSNPSFDNKGKKSCAPSLKGEATCRNVNPYDSTNRANSISLSSSSKIKSQSKKEMAGKSNDVKIDKRKWALEVLARKTARENKNENQGKQENIGVLKGNYPLLAQLPSDMRPILAPSRHNKVPTSVRQVQLYRLTEHFLKKENLPVICRTAATELAVADAVNIEREVADRSNSKLVYVNLCSQVLSQHAKNKKDSGVEESKSSPPSEDTTGTTEPTFEDTLSDPTVEDALRMAGLISDSPPNSPSCVTKNLDDNDPTETVIEEGGPESVFDMDSHPELDIYGDFEYDLDDEDYIGTGALRASKLQPEPSDLKMKVIFSTLNIEKTKNDQDSKDNGRLQTVEVPMDSSCILKCEKNGGFGISTLEVKENAPCLPPETLQDEGNEEPSLAECEELYGPDKEPLEKRFPQIASRKPDKMIGDGTSTEKIAFPENESCKPSIVARSSNVVTDSCTGRFVADQDSFGGENSPNLSSTSQNFQRKELECNDKQSGLSHSISKKVEAYIKEHIRPLCKSGVITVEQYRWAVGKTTEKVMKHHSKAKNANFIIKEGEKVKKLAEQYVEAAQQKGRMEIAPNLKTTI
ncbi:uncharacterized protein At4g10930 isoform X2 [Telopea speciosissima]|uniref:uncharacterized protein At4g10930 isoform X2 n=1 Tax=Telopea speciosissima TaxID=54955 RepID=UPI001CC6236C|nr:uncharacterized protein At4g10930 isoform X2 [Telopea speciosissima]